LVDETRPGKEIRRGGVDLLRERKTKGPEGQIEE
jgi:hypothetical protein